jgi:hypothetical protein
VELLDPEFGDANELRVDPACSLITDCGIGKDGAPSVRPDEFVAWRMPRMSLSAAERLTDMLGQIPEMDGVCSRRTRERSIAPQTDARGLELANGSRHAILAGRSSTSRTFRVSAWGVIGF